MMSDVLACVKDELSCYPNIHHVTFFHVCLINSFGDRDTSVIEEETRKDDVEANSDWVIKQCMSH